MKKTGWIQGLVLLLTLVGAGYIFYIASGSDDSDSTSKISTDMEYSAESDTDNKSYNNSKDSREQIPVEETNMVWANIDGTDTWIFGKHWSKFTEEQKSYMIENRMTEIMNLDYENMRIVFKKDIDDYIVILDDLFSKPENKEKKVISVFNDVVLATTEFRPKNQ